MSQDEDGEFAVSTLQATAAGLLIPLFDISGSMNFPLSKDDETPKIKLLADAVEGAMLSTLRNPPAGVTPIVGFVTVGGDVKTISPVPAANAVVPELVAAGGTPLGSGLDAALDMLEETYSALNSQGIPCKAPLVLVVTDGEPNGPEVQRFADAVQRARALKHLQLVGVTVTATDAQALRQFSFEHVEVVRSKEDLERVIRWASLGSMSGKLKKKPSQQAPFVDLDLA